MYDKRRRRKLDTRKFVIFLLVCAAALAIPIFYLADAVRESGFGAEVRAVFSAAGGGTYAPGDESGGRMGASGGGNGMYGGDGDSPGNGMGASDGERGNGMGASDGEQGNGMGASDGEQGNGMGASEGEPDNGMGAYGAASGISDGGAQGDGLAGGDGAGIGADVSGAATDISGGGDGLPAGIGGLPDGADGLPAGRGGLSDGADGLSAGGGGLPAAGAEGQLAGRDGLPAGVGGIGEGSISAAAGRYGWPGGLPLEQDAGSADIVITLSAIGDCTLGHDDKSGYQNRFDQVYAAVGRNPAYFFENVVDILSDDDLTIANLETVFTESKKKADKAYCFHGPPEYVKILELGSVEAVNIANNHIYDFFQKGFDDTVATLNNSSVEYFGYDTYRVMDIRGVKVGLAGFHIGGGGWSDKKKAVTKALETLRAQADLVVISFHWGIEGNYKQSGDQQSLAHYCIDNGADLVLGHHPHTLQRIETYKGHTIAYSLGNFCFGGNRNPKDKDSIILRQQFTFSAEDLSLAEIGEPTVIPVSVSSVSDRNDYRPTVVTGAAAERVLKKVMG